VSSSAQQREQPRLSLISAVLAAALILDGTLALLGCTFGGGSISGRLYGGVAASILVITGLFIADNRQNASRLLFVSAVLLSIDQIVTLVGYPLHRSFASLRPVGHAVYNILVYLLIYAFYARWRVRDKTL
jgi:hypothetical protein